MPPAGAVRNRPSSHTAVSSEKAAQARASPMTYRAPVRDLIFTLTEVAGVDAGNPNAGNASKTLARELRIPAGASGELRDRNGADNEFGIVVRGGYGFTDRVDAEQVVVVTQVPVREVVGLVRRPRGVRQTRHRTERRVGGECRQAGKNKNSR